jgi:hypothetical protein
MNNAATKSISPKTALEHFEALGYECVGFVFVKPGDTVVLWHGDFPRDQRDKIMEDELAGNYREGPPLAVV